jgi:hypothetical protein
MTVIFAACGWRGSPFVDATVRATNVIALFCPHRAQEISLRSVKIDVARAKCGKLSRAGA